ncbi:MAG: NIPSNAP family protein [Bacteroidales bacterium]|nr:NIPSNAP family protein [Bacteroidales bacterium]
MKRRSFVKNSFLATGSAMTFVAAGLQETGIKDKSFYELRIYHIARGGNNKGLLEQLYKQAFIPFLNRHNVNVLAFDEYSLEEPVKVWVLIAYPSVSVYLSVMEAQATDTTFLEASKSYHEIPSSTPVFTRFETFLLEAFDRLPSVLIPSVENKLFELRIYESPNEDAGRKKVTMFNKEEIDLFLKFGLQPVFFGKILAGQYMPALIYMIALPDMAGRDMVWDKFNTSEEWAVLRAKPEYANIVSNIRRIFLTPINWT